MKDNIIIFLILLILISVFIVMMERENKAIDKISFEGIPIKVEYIHPESFLGGRMRTAITFADGQVRIFWGIFNGVRLRKNNIFYCKGKCGDITKIIIEEGYQHENN